MSDVQEKTHAKLSPSGAHRWSRCPGSVVLEAQVPNESSPYARWGTAAHEVMAWCLEPVASGGTRLEDADANAFLGRVVTVEGHDITVDDEMVECVNAFIYNVGDYYDAEAGDILLVEQTVPLQQITDEKGAEGTADVVILKPNAREIVVIDLKGGQGVQVEAEDNDQLVMYAGGAVFEHDMLHGPFERVTMVISQPRREHLSDETIEIDELDARLAELASAAFKVWLAEGGYASTGEVRMHDEPLNEPTHALQPGEKQCRFCNAKAFCPALRGNVEAEMRKAAPPAVADDFDDLSLPKKAAAVAGEEVVSTLDADALAEAMRAAPLIEMWLNAVRAETDRRLMAGEAVPGFKVVQGKRGNRAWSDPAEAERLLKGKARLKADEMYEKRVISVTVAEKLLKPKPKVWALLAGLITQSEGKPSVAPESDPRPALTLGAPAEDFPEIEDEVDPLS